MSARVSDKGGSWRYYAGVLVVLSMLVAACGDGSGSPETTATTAGTDPEVTTTEGEEVTTTESETVSPEERPGSGEVIVSSWGGVLQDASREAFWTPFSEKTGIRVLEGEGPTQAVVKVQVDSGNPEWDIITSAVSIFNEFGPDYFEPIDYETYADAYAEIPDDRKQEYMVAANTWCSGLAYRTDVYGDNPPQSWEDFWDVDAFPGSRGMALDGGVPWNSVEAAWLASGQADRDDLYGSIDLDVVYDMFTELSPHIGKWWDSSAENAQLLAQGELDMTIMSTSGALELIEEGVPVAVTWDDAICGADYWYILKGARNHDNAQQLIAFMQGAEVLGHFANLLPLGVPNPNANDYIDEATARNLPTHPDNIDKVILQEFSRAEFWGANREAVADRHVAWSLEHGG